MAIGATDIRFMYPQLRSDLQNGRVGGAMDLVELSDANVDGETQLFNTAIKYGTDHVQYQKLFIKNVGDETATSVTLYGYNVNGTGKVTLAVECGQNQQAVVNGTESSKTNEVPPNLYVVYTFAEVAQGSPIALPNIPSGSGIGIWLKLEFTSIGANASKDVFELGVNFQGIAGTPLLATKDIGHSRIDGAVNIIRMKKNTKMFNGYDIEYQWIDTTGIGIVSAEAVYAVYIDREFKIESMGSSVASVQLYNTEVPMLIEIFLLPYGGYRPVLDPPPESNRIRLTWDALNPEQYDVERHVIYWDNATGQLLTRPMVEMLAKDASGGGSSVESVKKLI